MVVFKIFGFIIMFLGFIHTILSFSAKYILKTNGYEITYIITQPFYEVRILKKLSKENPRYRPIFILHRLFSYIFLCVFVLTILGILGYIIFQETLLR